MLSDLASSAKYPEVRRAAEKKKNAINLLLIAAN